MTEPYCGKTKMRHYISAWLELNARETLEQDENPSPRAWIAAMTLAVYKFTKHFILVPDQSQEGICVKQFMPSKLLNVQ